MATLFAGDESGNLSFTFSQGGTLYFVLVIAGFEEPDHIRQRMEQFRRKRGLTGREFSFHEISSLRLKERLMKFLATLPFHAWALVVKKSELDEPYRVMPKNTLYTFLLSEVIRRMPQAQRDRRNLILDEFDRSGKTLLELGHVLKTRGIKRGFKKIVAKRSSSDSLIQIADLVAGATFWRFAKGDERFFRLVAHRVSVI